MARTIELEDQITVGALADKLDLPVSRLITELMKNGVLVTVNERVDFDTAQIIVGELGLDIELAKTEQQPLITSPNRSAAISDHAVSRPPVVAVMGHVDHGKTSILDAIRGTKVVESEAGGITQHISAYQVSHNGRQITFLDTPGHEAFAAIREHSAQLTDVAIIVVAADDGVKPQTIEAIRFARQANARMIVAINKVDKEGANINRVKQELAENNLATEGWGGDIVAVEVSAKTGKGIDQLMDMVLLVADLEDLRAEVEGPASGLIIEAHTETGRGAIAHALVEQGTLKRGDFVVANGTYAKIRNLESPTGEPLLSATPSTPVIITGFKALPNFGDIFQVVESEKLARQQSSDNSELENRVIGRTDLNSNELLRLISRKSASTDFNIIVKADVQGSLTSVLASIKTLGTEEVTARIVGSGVGTITENDINLAHGSNAVIYGFNVNVPSSIKRLAARDKVVIRSYNIIYELIDDVRENLSALLAPEVIEKESGVLSVKGVFKTTKTEIICGGEVLSGKLVVPALVHIKRDKALLAEAEVTNLKRGPQDVKEVLSGEMCGVSLKTTAKLELKEGDRLEEFTREVMERHL